MLYLTLSVFSTYDTHYFHGVVFIMLALLKVRSQEKDKVFRCTCYFNIYFFESLYYKSLYTTSWIYYNLYHTYNTSPFFIRHSVFVYQKTNFKVLSTQAQCAWRYICLKSQNVLHITFAHISSVYLKLDALES